MGVFAYKADDTHTAYFTNAKFAKHSTQSYWVGEGTTYYWPFQGYLDFYFYAPHQTGNNASVTNSVSEKKLTISTFTNADYTSESYDGEGPGLNYNCADLMYGSTIIRENKEGAVDNAGISVTLKHALALVQVKATAATSVVKIQSMKLEDTPKTAKLTVNYAGSPITGSPSWTNWQEQNLDLTIFDNSTNPASISSSLTQLGNEVLVIPGKPQTSFTITYTLGDFDTVFTATLPLNDGNTPTWEPGKKYVYKISFGLEEIKFAPEVVEWGTGGVAEGSNGGVSVEEVSES